MTGSVVLSSSGDILIGSSILSRLHSAAVELLSGLESGVLAILPVEMDSKIDMAEADLDSIRGGVKVGHRQFCFDWFVICEQAGIL